jgi:hypothetical protein
MADDSKSGGGGGSKKLPNFYSQVGDMYAGGGAGKPKPAAGADAGEKVTNVKALLEVFKKMDKMENDPAAKDIIQQMATLAQSYMDKVQGGGAGAGTPPPAAGTSTGTEAGMSPGAAAGAGAGGGTAGGTSAPPMPV